MCDSSNRFPAWTGGSESKRSFRGGHEPEGRLRQEIFCQAEKVSCC